MQGTPFSFGGLTGRVAGILHRRMSQDFLVLCSNHDPANRLPHQQVHKTVCWYDTAPPVRGLDIADLDITVVHREQNMVCALVEMEDIADRPKTIIGDAAATLIGRRLSYQSGSGHVYLKVDRWTVLMVLAARKGDPNHGRLGYLQQMVNALHAGLRTQNSIAGSAANAALGQVVLGTFGLGLDEETLAQELADDIEREARRSADRRR